MLFSSSPDATQWIGIAAFGLAAAACARAVRGAGDDRSAWTVIAWLLLAAALECGMGLRHGVHAAIAGLLERRGAYGGRAPWQAVLSVLALGSATAAAAWIARRRWQHRATTGAARAALALAALFAVETVSLHAVDALLYRPAGPCLLIGWLWLAIGVRLVVCSRAVRGKRGLPP